MMKISKTTPLTLIISSPDDWKDIIPIILQKTKDTNVILLSGEIGAGKTTFVKAFCDYIGVKDLVNSPTFSLINEYSYRDTNEQEQLVYHADLYRLKNLEEALDIGIEDYLYGANYCLIEWPEIIEAILPEKALRINLEILDNSSRKIVFL